MWQKTIWVVIMPGSMTMVVRLRMHMDLLVAIMMAKIVAPTRNISCIFVLDWTQKLC